MRMAWSCAAAVLALAGLTGCRYAYRVDCDPPDAAITADGAPLRSGATLFLKTREALVEARRPGFLPYSSRLRHGGLLGVQRLGLKLERERYRITLDLAVGGGSVSIDGGPPAALPLGVELASGAHRLAFRAPGYPDWAFDAALAAPGRLVYRPQSDRAAIKRIRPLGIFRCGLSPKQVNFSPDGSRLFVSLLDGKGFDILDWRAGKITSVEPPGYGASLGFVEGLFVPGRSSFLITQMTRDMVHEFRMPAPGDEAAPTWLRSFSTHGTWSKVVAYSPSADVLAVSNWVSNDVSILDYSTGELRKRLGGINTPRGLAFSPDGSTLTVAAFGDGRLLRYGTADWRLRDSLVREGGALRHIVATGDGSRLFVSDMARAEVIEVDAASFAVLHVYKTRNNPNTIDLTSDGRILAVSCRGPNNAEGYTLRSPVRGAVLLFDTRERRLIATLEGGTQPTGLDISADDATLAFSNFQDASVELYDISRLLDR